MFFLKRNIWPPDFNSGLLPAGVTALYFCQNEYTETVYVGQPAGTPVLQVHAMQDSASERPHFYLCWTSSLRRSSYVSWFHLDISTGVLSLNKTLEESDFALLCESDVTILIIQTYDDVTVFSFLFTFS